MDKQIAQRKAYLDIIKGLAMLLVVMQHVGGTLNPELTFICKVDVPLFFVVSGYLAAKSEVNVKNELVKKTKRIIYPFAVALLFWTLLHDLSIQDVIMDMGKCGYWFLPCLFFFYVIYYSIQLKNYVREKWFISTICMIEVLLLGLSKCGGTLDDIIGFSYMSRYFPCFMAGVCIKRYEIEDVSKLIGSILLVVTSIAFTYHGSSTNINFLQHVVGYVCGSTLLFFFVKNVESELPESLKDFFCIVGKKSLSIYIIHFYFVTQLPSTTGSFPLDFALVVGLSLLIVILSIALQEIFVRTTYLYKLLD